MNHCMVIARRRSGVEMLRGGHYVGAGVPGRLAEAVQLAADDRIATDGGLDFPERAEALLEERVARPEEQAVVFHLAQIGDAARPQHAARLAEDGDDPFARNVLEEPRAMDGIEGSGKKRQLRGIAADEGKMIAHALLLVAGRDQLRKREIAAEELHVRESRPQPSGHRSRAAGQVEHRGAGTDLDAVEDPAREEASLRFEAGDFDGVRLAVDVLRHGARKLSVPPGSSTRKSRSGSGSRAGAGARARARAGSRARAGARAGSRSRCRSGCRSDPVWGRNSRRSHS